MTVAVFGADEQSGRPVDVDRWVHLAEAVLDAEGVRGEVEVSLLFVDEGSIAELNQRFLGQTGPTDVLAFPIDDEPAESGRSPDAGGSGPGWVPAEPEDLPLLLGDVVICPDVAWRNADSRAVPYEDELALLVVHGLLHLQGMNHEEDDEAEAMEARERELLGRFYPPARVSAPPGPDPAPPGPDPAPPGPDATRAEADATAPEAPGDASPGRL
ncbi:MAG: rRNA maturation RNase YbeY [Acidimicrobiales bacterium]